MGTDIYETERNLNDFLQLNHFETLTYDKLLEIKEVIDNKTDCDVPHETVEKINRLIEKKKNEIISMEKLQELGYTLNEGENFTDVVRSKMSRRSDIAAIIIGFVLSIFAFMAFFMIFGYLLNIIEEDFTYMTFVMISLMLFLGGTGIVLSAKGIIRRKKNNMIMIGSDPHKIIYVNNGKPEAFQRDMFKFFKKAEGSKQKLILRSKNGEGIEKEIFEFEFSNKAYSETLDLLIDKLNS